MKRPVHRFVASLLAFLAASAALAGGPGLGDRLPLPIMATAVVGRMPSFREPGAVSVLAFVRTADAKGRGSLRALDGAARAQRGKATVVAVCDEPVSLVRDFAATEGWDGGAAFVLAADPVRHAVQTVFGRDALPALPTAFIVRDGVVQWQGAPSDVGVVLAEVVAGRWDLGAARRADEQRRLWDAEMDRIDAMARGGRHDEALAALDVACESALPAQAAQCSGRRFALLLSAGRLDEALKVGDGIVCNPANAKQAAGLAWNIANTIPGNAKALAFALRAAESSDRALSGKDAMVGAILARVQYLSGDRERAAETARRALSCADSKDVRTAIEEDLAVYAPTARPKPPAR
jgi:hypothetical protein